MDTIMSWAKENFDLIVLLVSVAGVFIACLSLIYELKEKKKKNTQKKEDPEKEDPEKEGER